MPLYEYICTQCGTEFEKILPFSEANSKPECPTCQSRETLKRISLFASNGGDGNSSSSASSGCGSSGRFT